MTNQSSCRMNRPGYTAPGRSMSGRTMPAPGCSGNSSRTMPAPSCSGSSRQMQSHRQEINHSCSDQSAVTCVKTADFPVGMAYVPMQTWGPLYNPQKALSQGTLFPELDKPFSGGRTVR